ncbi:M55 family metallopeptidase [Armatimonas sp.]|uniref:M55 family metallopeptidase n=1 Tax=Armatimonas sp. TaxID=1872638 RepID=UPI003752EE73
MRVLIMSDMEGVSGIVTWKQVEGGSPMFEEGRRLYTEEINAAVRGAVAAGATEIVAVDCHGAGGDWTFNSYVPELLHPACEWVAHHTWSRYTELLEQGCDACLCVGMHARAGTPDGVMCHTISTVTWRNLWFNDDFGCPVALVTGDEATCREGREILGDDPVYVAVKRGLSRYSARQIPPVRARQMIEDGAREALSRVKKGHVYTVGSPTTITVEVETVDKVGQFRNKHGVEVIEKLKVQSKADNWMAAWDQIWPQAEK